MLILIFDDEYVVKFIVLFCMKNFSGNLFILFCKLVFSFDLL